MNKKQVVRKNGQPVLIFPYFCKKIIISLRIFKQ